MNDLGKENTIYTIDAGIDPRIKKSLPVSHIIPERAGDDRESMTRENIIFEDSSDLPSGWSRFKERRTNSNSYDRCILTSCGTKIDRQKKLNEFISLKDLDLNISFSGKDCCDNTRDKTKRKLLKEDESSDDKTCLKKRKPNIVSSIAQEETKETPHKAEAVHVTSEVTREETDLKDTEDQVEEDTALPKGWSRKQIAQAFTKQILVVIQTADGKQFDNQKKLNSYIARNKLNVKVSIDGPFDENHRNKTQPTEDISEKTVDDSSKREKKKGKKERTVETDGSLTNKEVDLEKEAITKDEENYIVEIEELMKSNSLPFTPSPPTKGDGNCWFRAVAEQVECHNIANKARNYRALRLEVCNHLRHLPEEIQQNMINVVFVGKKRGLADLATRQRKDGQWVDNTGVMVLATALYLARNIHIYSYGSSHSDFSLTKIEGGEGADDRPPITIFFHDRHYQTLKPITNVTSMSS